MKKSMEIKPRLAETNTGALGHLSSLSEKNISTNELGWLIDAAIADPNKPMAGGATEELLARSKNPSDISVTAIFL